MYLLSIDKNIINMHSLIYSVPMESLYSVNVPLLPLYLSIMLQVISTNTARRVNCAIREKFLAGAYG